MTDIDPALFRQVLGQFPTGVTIVTAALEGRLVGMTANSFASVSLDPPLVSWCIAQTATNYAAFVEAEGFAVHMLGADDLPTAIDFATRSGKRFAGREVRIDAFGAPILTGLAPVLSCRTWARYPGGDHMILVGLVLAATPAALDPLMFHVGELRPMTRPVEPVAGVEFDELGTDP